MPWLTGLYVSLVLYAAALPVSMALTNAAAAAAAFFSVALLARGRRRIPIRPYSLAVLAAFFLWTVMAGIWVGAAFRPESLDGFRKIWNFLPYVLIPAGIGLGTARVQRIIKALVCAGSIVALLGGLEYFAGIRYFFEGWFGSRALVQEGRFTGFQSHPLHSGALYSILCLTALAQTLFHRSFVPGSVITADDIRSLARSKYFWGANALVLAFAVILTGSRSYYLGLLAGAAALLMIRGWKFFLGGLAVAAALFSAAAGMDAQLRGRIGSLDFRRTDQSARLRIYMWRSALDMVRDQPSAGIGYRNWGRRIPDYARRYPGWELDEAAFAHAHNSYLTVAAETGLLGLGIFLLFWFALLREQLAAARRTSPMSFARALALTGIAALATLAVAAFFEHNLLTATPILALSLILGISRTDLEPR